MDKKLKAKIIYLTQRNRYWFGELERVMNLDEEVAKIYGYASLLEMKKECDLVSSEYYASDKFVDKESSYSAGRIARISN